MNKKAQNGLFIVIVAIAFLFSSVLFYGSLGKSQPGGESLFLGENEIVLFETYLEAEQDIYYIELSARIAARNADPDNFENSFEDLFEQYLANTGMTIEDYSINFNTEGDKVTVIAKTDKFLEYNGGKFVYKISPNVRTSSPSSSEDTVEERQAFIE